MPSEAYKRERKLYAYSLYKNNKLFKKSRAIVVDDKNNIYLIYRKKPNGNEDYIFPGGGVEENETASEAAMRETLEEYGLVVKNPKYISRHYYSTMVELDGTEFDSKRVEYFYICELDKTAAENENFGLSGEFSNDGNEYKKVKVTLEQLKKIEPQKLNNMDKKIFKKLINILETR